MYKYLVVFEKTNTGYSAFVPNLPGCIASGPDRPTTEQSVYEAIQPCGWLDTLSMLFPHTVVYDTR